MKCSTALFDGGGCNKVAGHDGPHESDRPCKAGCVLAPPHAGACFCVDVQKHSITLADDAPSEIVSLTATDIANAQPFLSYTVDEEDEAELCPSVRSSPDGWLKCLFNEGHDESHRNVTGKRVLYWTDPVERCPSKGPHDAPCRLLLGHESPHECTDILSDEADEADRVERWTDQVEAPPQCENLSPGFGERCELDAGHDDSHRSESRNLSWRAVEGDPEEADPSNGLLPCTFEGPLAGAIETATGADLATIGAALSPPVPRILEPDHEYRERLAQAMELAMPRSADRPEEVPNGIQVCDEKNCCQLRRVGNFCSEHAATTTGLE